MRTCVLNPVLGTVLTTAAVYLSHFYGVAAPEFSVKSGEDFVLDASSSASPDGDSLSYLWFNYPEAGSWKSPITINSAENASGVYVKSLGAEIHETAHFILKVMGKSKPTLTRYRRAIVAILPQMNGVTVIVGNLKKADVYGQSCRPTR